MFYCNIIYINKYDTVMANILAFLTDIFNILGQVNFRRTSKRKISATLMAQLDLLLNLNVRV